MGLSPEEERHIQNLSVIPTALVFYVFLGYFVYLFFVIKSPIATKFFVQYFVLVFMLVFPVTYFGSEQVLRSRREKRPLASYTKRFVGNVSLFIIGAVIFEVVWVLTNLTLSSLTNSTTVVIVTGIIWFAIWALTVFHFREKFSNLSKGDW
jgi:hypothetical protein